MNKVETLWESKEQNHEGKPFFKVKRSRGYYIFGERVGVDSICFILYDSKTKKFALINEAKPGIDTETKLCRMTTAFGGSIDVDGMTPLEICQMEVKEESGYVVPLTKIYECGTTLVSTQMSQLCITYLVDITGIEKTLKAEYELEASEVQKEKDANEFSGNEIRWMDIREVMENGDWKSVYISMQAIYKDFIQKS